MLEALTFFNIHGMIFDQTVDGSFFNDLQVYVKLLGDLTQELGIVIGERPDETDRVVVIVVLADASREETAQVVCYQVVYVVIVQIIG